MKYYPWYILVVLWIYSSCNIGFAGPALLLHLRMAFSFDYIHNTWPFFIINTKTHHIKIPISSVCFQKHFDPQKKKTHLQANITPRPQGDVTHAISFLFYQDASIKSVSVSSHAIELTQHPTSVNAVINETSQRRRFHNTGGPGENACWERAKLCAELRNANWL